MMGQNRIPLLPICIFITLLCVHRALQQTNADKNIDSIFDKNFGEQATTQTPRPDDLTPSKCKCVPYNMCDDESTNTNRGFHYRSLSNGCNALVEKCCDKNHISEFPTIFKSSVRSEGCGFRNIDLDFKLRGGDPFQAGFAEFPWTVALMYATNYSYFCAGSLIHPQVVLTAAHCIPTHMVSTIVVRAGEWDTQTNKERLPYQEKYAQRIIQHPQFNHRNGAYDFALIVLDSAFTLADHINVACLPSQNAIPAARTVCFSTGWGKDAFNNAAYSAIMKKVLLPIVEFNDCQTQLQGSPRLGQYFQLHQSLLCAGGILNEDTCKGDGGGPLMCPIGDASDERYQQSGIVAWGVGCKDAIPAAYSNVAMARNWIDEQMIANGFGTNSYSA